MIIINKNIYNIIWLFNIISFIVKLFYNNTRFNIMNFVVFYNIVYFLLEIYYKFLLKVIFYKFYG